MNDLQKLIDKVIDKAVVGCDTYKHNGSTWLLFTDDKKWVIELTKEGTLWYNYYFFQKLFKVIALDVVENQHHITKWVEDTVINGVKSTRKLQFVSPSRVEDTVINGVKSTCPADAQEKLVEDTVINGVKETKGEYYKEIQKVEYTIQNGVKVIHPSVPRNCIEVEYTIQNGVKRTSNRRLVVSKDIEDTIQNGVKRTLDWRHHKLGYIEDTIQNGVKYTHPMGKDKESIVSNDFGMNEAIQNGVKHTQGSIFDNPTTVKDTIQNGVKVTYSDKIPHEYDWSNQFIEEIDDIIQNGVKHTEKSLQIDGSCVIEDVIKEGVKHTEYGDWLDGDERLDDIIKNGVKETTPGGYLGSVEMKGKIVHQFEHSKQDDDVKDVIKNGIKKTEAAALFDEESKMDTVISNGIKETHDDAYHHTGRVGGVIKNGVKQCIPSRTPLYNPMDFSVQYRENHRLDDVASVLEKGIKEVQPLPSQEGNMDYSNYYYRQGVPTKPHTKYVDDVITNGIKKTKAMDEWVNTDRIVDGVISNGKIIK